MKRITSASNGCILATATAIAASVFLSGCGPHFGQFRLEGQRALMDGRYAVAKVNFEQAHNLRPEDALNLFDLGTVHMVYARSRMDRMDKAAAMREVDQAIVYFSRAIDTHPGMVAASHGKNEALEFKGRFDQALAHTEWAAAFVGPSAKQQLILASEFLERGDLDGALLCYRQAVAMEPRNAHARAVLARFLLDANQEGEAIEHLKRAYEADPFEPGIADLLTTLGVSLPRTTAPLPQ